MKILKKTIISKFLLTRVVLCFVNCYARMQIKYISENIYIYESHNSEMCYRNYQTIVSLIIKWDILMPFMLFYDNKLLRHNQGVLDMFRVRSYKMNIYYICKAKMNIILLNRCQQWILYSPKMRCIYTFA